MSARRMTILAPEGMLGYGIPVRSMVEGMKRNPDAIAVDAGSTDPGPYYLGAGVPFEKGLRTCLVASGLAHLPHVRALADIVSSGSSMDIEVLWMSGGLAILAVGLFATRTFRDL